MNFANMLAQYWAYGNPEMVVLSTLIAGGCICCFEKTIPVNGNALEAHSKAFCIGCLWYNQCKNTKSHWSDPAKNRQTKSAF